MDASSVGVMKLLMRLRPGTLVGWGFVGGRVG